MKELTLLEKFAAGWEIRHGDGTTAIQVVKYKSKDKYWIEWSDGTGNGFDYSDAVKYITCTPPRERRWVNVWVTDAGSSYAYQNRSEEEARKDVETDDLGGDFITTLCIERVDGRWQLVKDENEKI